MTSSARAFAGKRYWLVGASAGLGRAIALELSGKGALLVLSARNEAALQDLAETLPGQSDIAPCDVRDQQSLDAVLEKVPNIDGVIFCAGVYQPLRAQDWNAEQIEAMCDINFTGSARVISAALPRLLAQKRGHIVLIGSLAGFRGLPGAQGYGASKAGVIHLAQQLRVDLPADKFKVQLVNPGFIKTRLTDKNEFSMPFLMSPEEAARRVIGAMRSNRFETSFPRRFAAIFALLGLLPEAVYTPLARRMTR